ncbi:hypothetical protein O181_051612 [Austropuccinia psidii MF-1]|uniref:Uncharacterized protein n=1 Tax=Austropuccinia psidii MF-1 TaxID=1389203 RepID=A0A9Q3E1A2_9BASI|nr:hypothetical protein [Austropuccinia psidii MF-1]
MPIQHSPPARQTRSQARDQAILTPTPRAPLDSTPAVPQLRAPYGKKRAQKIKFFFRSNGEEEEDSDGTEGVPAPLGASQGTGGPTLALSNQPVSHESEPSLLAIMQKMTQIMANIQAASSSEVSRPQAFKTSFMKAPEAFDRTQPFKVRSFIQYCQLIFIMIQKTSLKTERRFFMPPHCSLAGLQNGLSLIFPTLPIKTQAIFSILGNYLHPNSSPYLATQMKLEKLKQSWMP